MLGLAPILKLRCQQGPVAAIVLKRGQSQIKPCTLLAAQGHGLRSHQHLKRSMCMPQFRNATSWQVAAWQLYFSMQPNLCKDQHRAISQVQWCS